MFQNSVFINIHARIYFPIKMKKLAVAKGKISVQSHLKNQISVRVGLVTCELWRFFSLLCTKSLGIFTALALHANLFCSV